MQAIILVGGFGTRLRQVVPDLPKPMAPIQHQPFLAYLLQYLSRRGIKKVILAVHYQAEKFRDYFQSRFADIDIIYAEEKTPLGTGGAIVHALKYAEDNMPCFVLNGDTFMPLDYAAMFDAHQVSASRLSLALRSVEDCSRYGKVITQEKNIIAFKEKGEVGPGLINAGIYLLTAEVFTHFHLPQQFSFEYDFMHVYTQLIKPQAFIANDYFIDIGIPEDYFRAMKELPSFLN